MAEGPESILLLKQMLWLEVRGSGNALFLKDANNLERPLLNRP